MERYERLGGVCLNVGCIPSKALLHVAKLITDGEDAAATGVGFAAPEIDLVGVRAFKDDAVEKLTGGLVGLAKGRKVKVLQGEARFTGAHTLDVAGEETVSFKHCIVAAGSEPIRLPDQPEDPRIMDSTGALELTDIPEKLLVVGGGIIGLEMATVYDALGSEVTVVELADQLIPGCDPDLVKPLAKRIGKRYAAVHLKTKVESMEAQEDGIHVSFASEEHVFDRVLVAVGRTPNGAKLGLDAAGVEVDERGWVSVDEQLRTNARHILAIGDVCRGPMLAHKATHEGHLAAEIIAGEDHVWDVQAIPSVAYTDPEVAWAGLTELEAKKQGTSYEKALFPWAASGRAIGVGRTDGSTKLLFDPESRRLLGAGIVGVGGGGADRRARPRPRDGRGHRGRRDDRPPAPDPLRDGRPRLRGRRRDDHRPAQAAGAVTRTGVPCASGSSPAAATALASTRSSAPSCVARSCTVTRSLASATAGAGCSTATAWSFRSRRWRGSSRAAARSSEPHAAARCSTGTSSRGASPSSGSTA